MNKTEEIRKNVRFSRKAKRWTAALIALVMMFAFSAVALADGGRTEGTGRMAAQMAAETSEDGNGQQARQGQSPDEAGGVAIDKIEAAIAAVEDETVRAELQALLDAYVTALEAKGAAMDDNKGAGVSEYALAASDARDALEAALADAGIVLDDILGVPLESQDGDGRALNQPELDVEAIRAQIAAMNGTDEEKETLNGLLNAYQAAVSAETQANVQNMGESERIALQEATAAAQQALLGKMQDCGLDGEMTQTQAGEAQTAQKAWSFSILNGSESQGEGLLQAVWSWLKGLFD